MHPKDNNIIKCIPFLKVNNNDSIIRLDNPHLKSRKKTRDFFKKNGYWKPKTYVGNKGYIYMHLIDRPVLLHRVIAILLIKNPLNFTCVNHKDGNKLNNHVSNLEWCSYSYNTKHSYNVIKTQSYNDLVLKGKKGNMKRIVLTKKLSIKIYRDYLIGNTSYRELAKKYSIGKTTVERAVKSKGQIYFAKKIKQQ
ncbi:HNH endonuclease [Tenacibaculum phage Gundel_1]|uniref:HNH homing endonuclease n=1 Tax=Tenacibaculum phage Gundel_1 TaxID=2745672 RepID=A0A8E4ZG00_9CAUD|nr:HNH endonuclease [Tenacibaculum phage Gundel_1]QQV91500.1 HNH homing endonuclease [Tenacibaculum phage Gundel_1]